MAKFCSRRSLDILIISIKFRIPSGGREDWLQEDKKKFAKGDLVSSTIERSYLCLPQGIAS